MMTVAVETDPTFTVGKPREIFEGSYEMSPGGGINYDVMPDGQRFVTTKPKPQPRPTQIHVVLNWFGEFLTVVKPFF